MVEELPESTGWPSNPTSCPTTGPCGWCRSHRTPVRDGSLKEIRVSCVNHAVMKNPSSLLLISTSLVLGVGALSAKPKSGERPEAVALEAAGQNLQARYAAMLDELKAGLTQAIPTISATKVAAFEQATEAAKQALDQANAAQAELGKIGGGKALIDHAKNKWIGGAEKGIAEAKEALGKATTDADREAANKKLAEWQANKEEGVKALKERTAAYEAAKAREPELKKAHDAAQAVLAASKKKEREAANAILSEITPIIGSDRLDAKFSKFVIISHATPQGLAKFGQQSPEHAALVEKLLADPALMKEMLVAGGASFGKYGQAMEIFTQIQKASAKAKEGMFYRLALGTSLEHASPIAQGNPKSQTDAPQNVDPVKRYLHYEKAYLDGELDPAFKTFSAWEYRHVVNCDAPDEFLTWGRQMLRTYRPDHIYNADYGWRYVAAVRTEVPYGSQNVKYDRPELQPYQNIIMNGGVCGRRAFFGRFILRCFGIPTWGVTQKAHAALSHWTPKGWVVNLGAGFQASWWDKEEVSMSGNQFLLETQARAHADEYLKVLRAQWVSRLLGEPAYNDRKKVTGGIWSRMAFFSSLVLSETSVALGPLGQELGEANEKEQKLVTAAVTEADKKITVGPDGIILIPAVAHAKASGKASTMKSIDTGMQIHVLGGFKASYEIEVPQAGTYRLGAQVATAQTGQNFIYSVNGKAIETPVPYTKGLWQQTDAVELHLSAGKNTLEFELQEGSRGVTIKGFRLSAHR